jgi:hypothetical protein
MEKVKRLGELVPETVPEPFTPAKPKKFNPELSEKLFRESEARKKEEQTRISARNYRELFTRLTGKEIDVDTEIKFDVLEAQYGKTMILETVEYMALKQESSWDVSSFMAYLLKVLQSKRKELEQEYSDKSPIDDYIEALDKHTRRQTRKLQMEWKRWERTRQVTGEQDVNTVVE